MPISSPSRNFGWQRFWFSLEHEIQSYHDCTKSDPYVIRQGEIAYAKGVVTTDFWEFLLRRGIKLTDDERWIISQTSARDFAKKGKPVVVTKRLGGGKYIVCRMCSWGGKFEIADLLSPVQKYFAFAMSGFIDDWPPGTKPLLFSPPVRKGQALMTIPLERDDVQPVVKFKRFFMSIGELERLERMINQREKSFYLIADKLRQSEVQILKFKTLPFRKWPRALREGFQKSNDNVVYDPNTLWNEVLPNHLRTLHDRLRLPRIPEEELMKYRDQRANRIRVPKSVNLLQWAFERTNDELVNCDIFMGLANPGVNTKYFGTQRHLVPRVVAGRKEIASFSRKSRNPIEKGRGRLVTPPVRPFCTVSRLTKILSKSHFLPLPF